MQNLIYALLTVPLVLLIATAIFEQFSTSSRSVFEQAITGETLGTLDNSPKTFYTDYPAKVNSAIIYAKNTTSGANVNITVDSIDYKDGLEEAEVKVNSTTVGSDIKVYADYTAYAKSGYAQWVRSYKGTWSGYNLSALLPFILIAITIVAAILGIAWLRG